MSAKSLVYPLLPVDPSDDREHAMVTYHSRESARRRRTPRRSTRAGRLDFNSLGLVAMQRGKFRLIIFRPGTQDMERVKVATFAWLAYRGVWVLLAPVGFFLLPAPPFSVGGLMIRILNAALFTGVALLVTWFLARPTLSRAHGISAIAAGTPNGGVRFSGNMSLLEEFTAELEALDESDLSPVAHEDEWGRIYNRLADVTSNREN